MWMGVNVVILGSTFPTKAFYLVSWEKDGATLCFLFPQSIPVGDTLSGGATKQLGTEAEE